MASALYNAWKYRQLGDTSISPINHKTDTLKLALVTSSYTPDIDAHDFFDDITNEVAASGSYAAGGATLSVTTSVDTTDDEGVLDATDITFTTFTGTARYAILYKSTGSAATSPLIAVIDLGQDYTATGGPFALTFSSEGIININ